MILFGIHEKIQQQPIFVFIKRDLCPLSFISITVSDFQQSLERCSWFVLILSKAVLTSRSHLLVFLFYFQGARGTLSRYVYFLKQSMGRERPRRLVDVKNCGFCALLRSTSVTQLEPDTIPLELKTMCRIPGMRDMLRKFQGGLHLRAWRTGCLGSGCLLEQSGIVTSNTQSFVTEVSTVLF